jgi:2-polyprenyl-3-methyl-5-hydroxy-6-metoxy-1,4-benzoquinol methylase
MTAPGWDAQYQNDESPPWDIGRPQVAFARLAAGGLLEGEVLDVGCGTGEQAMVAAASGADVTGIDISPAAIDRARRKAADRGLRVRFEVGDALDLAALGRGFEVIIDSGVFHVFDDADRARYVASLASVRDHRPGLATQANSQKT